MREYLLPRCMQQSLAWTVAVRTGLGWTGFVRPPHGSRRALSLRLLTCHAHFSSYIRGKESSHKLSMTRHASRRGGDERPWHNLRDNVKLRRSDDTFCAEPPIPGKKDWLFKNNSVRTVGGDRGKLWWLHPKPPKLRTIDWLSEDNSMQPIERFKSSSLPSRNPCTKC